MIGAGQVVVAVGVVRIAGHGLLKTLNGRLVLALLELAYTLGVLRLRHCFAAHHGAQQKSR